MSFKVSSVMTPKVPSDPIISWSRLYPELVLDTEEPNRVTSPGGQDHGHGLHIIPGATVFDPRMPPALVATFPPG